MLVSERGIDCRTVANDPALVSLDDLDALEAALAEHPVLVTADVPRDEHKSAILEGRRVPQLRRALVRQARFAIAHAWNKGC